MSLERTISPLLQKMQQDGFSLKTLCNEINLHFDLSVSKSDISNFINHRSNFIARRKKNIIRLFFIAHRWIPKPKTKPVPKCVFCHARFPLGKPRRASLNATKIQTLISQRNHKRTTKF